MIMGRFLQTGDTRLERCTTLICKKGPYHVVSALHMQFSQTWEPNRHDSGRKMGLCPLPRVGVANMRPLDYCLDVWLLALRNILTRKG